MLSINSATAQAAARMAADAIARQSRRAQEAAGLTLQRAIRANFLALAAGGVGVDGTQWEPLKNTRADRQAGKLIGVASGRMLGSISISGDGQQVGFAAGDGKAEKYMYVFDARRPLLPDRTPAAWKRQAERAAAAVIYSVSDKIQL